VSNAGGERQPCRWGEGCDGGIECVRGTCEHTGRSGEHCRRAEPKCDSSLYCGDSGYCVSPINTGPGCAVRTYVFCRRCAAEPPTTIYQDECSYDAARTRVQNTGTNCQILDGVCSQ
jgi:hypothetical protein